MSNYDLLNYGVLKCWAEMLIDTQEHRIRLENRIRSEEVDPEVFSQPLEHARANEHMIRKDLRRSFRVTAPPGVIAWQKASQGVGIDLLARLIGHLGHPRIARPMHWEGTDDQRKLIQDLPYERSVAQLWAYCGHGDPDLKRFAGMDQADSFALGIPKLKMLTHLIAECCIRQPGATLPDPATAQTIPRYHPLDQGLFDDVDDFPDPAKALTKPKSHSLDQGTLDDIADFPDPTTRPTIPKEHALDQGLFDTAGESTGQTKPSDVAIPWPYRQVYDERRLATFDRTHADDCRRCGPSSKPALAGSPWSRAHQHADGLRIVGKTLLRDLWIAAGE
jgi:hypothetical protein